jgi:hypothetical protein
MGQTSFEADDDLLRELENTLEYRETKKDVYTHAVRVYIQTAPMLDELFEREDRENRMKFIEAAVRKEVDRVRENPNYDGPDGGLPGE